MTKPLHQMTPEESHRAGVSPILALEARIAECEDVLAQRISLPAMLVFSQRADAFREALALIQPTATTSEGTNLAHVRQEDTGHGAARRGPRTQTALR